MSDKQDLNLLKAEHTDRQIRQQQKPSGTKQKKEIKSSWPSFLMLIIVLIGGYFLLQFLRNSHYAQQILNLINPQTLPEKNKVEITEEKKTVQKIEPAVAISTIPSQSTLNFDQSSKRVVIPGEITDQIEEKIQQQKGNEEIKTNALVNIKNAEKELLLNHTLPDTHFTLQLIITEALNDIYEFIKQYQLTNYHIYNLSKQNKKKFILIKGNFIDKAEAEKALLALPVDLPKTTLAIKTGAELKLMEQN